MIAVNGRRRPTGDERARWAAAGLELAILVTLLVFLGVAAGKLFLLLGRLGIPIWKGLPVGALFLVAAALTARRISGRLRALRRGDDDGSG